MQSDHLLIEWSRNAKLHQCIPASQHIHRAPVPQGYLLRILQLSGNPPSDHISYTITFFHKTSHSFFGRTYGFGIQNIVYYLSRIDDPNCVGICEIQTFDPATDRRTPLGWSELNVFTPSDASGQSQAIVFSGTPRILTNKKQAQQLPGYQLYYQVRILPQIKEVAHILPQDAFCGPEDVLPGIQGGKLPNNPRTQIQHGISTNLNITQIQIEPADRLQQEVIQQAKNWQRATIGQDTTQPPRVQSRKLLVGLHNTWGYQGGGTPQSMNVLRRTDRDTLSCNHLLVQKATTHPLLAVVFQVEFSIIVPRSRNLPPEVVNMIVAWAPYLGNRQTQTQIPMITGPGRSASGKMLWEFSRELRVGISFSISSQDIGRAQPVYISQISEPPQNDEKFRQLEHQKNREIQYLKAELEKSRKVRHQKPPEQPRVQPQQRKPIIRQQQVQVQTLQLPEPQIPHFDRPADYIYIDQIQSVSSQFLPQQSTYDAFIDGPRDISRADKARLVRSGVRGVMDFQMTGSIRPRLDIQAQDPLQASIFAIQFLAYRPPTRGTRMPSRVCFGFKFYSFPYWISQSVIIKQGDRGAPWVLQKDGNQPELVAKYEVQPVVWDNVDFPKYLLTKKLTVQVWDNISHIQLGFVRIPLRDTIRQGKPSIVITKEYPVLESLNGDQIGSLQVLLRNQGTAPSVRIQPSQNPLILTAGQAQHKYRAKAKVLQIQLQEHTQHIDNQDARKRLRVIEWKKSQRQTNEFWDKEKLIREASIIRQRHKPSLFRQVLREYSNTSDKIHARIGQAFTFEYRLRNPHPTQECFTISIQDPELTVVQSTAEWQWWISHFKYDRPPQFELISSQNSLVLKAGQECPVIFKFLSFNPKPKMISAWVHQTRGSPLCALQIQVIPQPCPVDHIFRFYQPENKIVKLSFPSLLSSDITHKPILHCTFPKAVVQWQSQTQVVVQLKSSAAPTITSFSIIAYDDPYFSQVKANWEIKLHSLVGIDMHINMGQSTATRLACPSEQARTVQLFSSNPSLASFPAPYDQPFSLLSKNVNSLPVNIRNDSTQTEKIRIHCVDIYHKKLVYAWILRVQTEASSITQVYEVRANRGISTDKQLAFSNKTQAFAVFHFRSSHPEILEVREPRLTLEGGAKGYVPVHIHPSNYPGQAEVCVFAADTEESIFEAFLFKISYV